ncbi:MAG: hypothetical protein Ct9H300mP16_09130 [Pseudomonadota bacterium]|nr:MAG: hypothetical protein Ct9H300mP16_09130 [Pseudomonadota bacterium]
MKKMPAGYGCCASGNPSRSAHRTDSAPERADPAGVAPVARNMRHAHEEFHNIQMFHRNAACERIETMCPSGYSCDGPT